MQIRVLKVPLYFFFCLTFAASALAEEEPAKPGSLSAESMRRLMEEMIWVEGGSFSMGSNSEKASTAEKPAHTVTLDGFYMGKFEVSQKLFQEVI